MNIRFFVFGIAALAASAGAYAKCAPPTAGDCLLASVEESLRELEQPEQWVAGAVEAAHAAAALAQRDRALTLLGQATGRVQDLAAAAAAKSLSSIAQTSAELGFASLARTAAETGFSRARRVSDAELKTDLFSRLLVASARNGQPELAASGAFGLSEASPNQASFKARTLRAIAVRSDVDAADWILARTTMGLSYYQAVGYVDVARSRLSEPAAVDRLLSEALRIARSQSDGYFVAGALREAGAAYHVAEQAALARELFAEAAGAARKAKTPQHQARALSRIATELADIGLYEQARELLPEALTIAGMEEDVLLRHWTHYEIAGAAAFAGDETALEVLGQIPEDAAFSGSALKDSATRDVAWGLARHGRWDEAVALARSIAAPLPRVQALARLIRLKVDPGLPAFSRYL